MHCRLQGWWADWDGGPAVCQWSPSGLGAGKQRADQGKGRGLLFQFRKSGMRLPFLLFSSVVAHFSSFTLACFGQWALFFWPLSATFGLRFYCFRPFWPLSGRFFYHFGPFWRTAF